MSKKKLFFSYRVWQRIMTGFNAASGRPVPSTRKQLQKLLIALRHEAAMEKFQHCGAFRIFQLLTMFPSYT